MMSRTVATTKQKQKVCLTQVNLSISPLLRELTANSVCQQSAPHGKQHQREPVARRLYISVSICVTGWKWARVHAFEYVGHWTPAPCGLGEVKGWLGL